VASYSNFYDAFVHFIGAYATWRNNLVYAEFYLEQSRDYADAGSWKFAIYSVCNAVQELVNTHNYCLQMDVADWRSNHFFSSIYWAWIEGTADGGEEFTMDLLLSTMVGATPEQVMYFIGLADAYRQSIWNKPFNVEYFAALARGFME